MPMGYGDMHIIALSEYARKICKYINTNYYSLLIYVCACVYVSKNVRKIVCQTNSIEKKIIR